MCTNIPIQKGLQAELAFHAHLQVVPVLWASLSLLLVMHNRVAGAPGVRAGATGRGSVACTARAQEVEASTEHVKNGSPTGIQTPAQCTSVHQAATQHFESATPYFKRPT